MDMSCHFTVEDFELYLQGRLDEARQSHVREHVDRCETCRQLLDEVRENAELAGQLCHALEGSSLGISGSEGEGGNELGTIEGYRLIPDIHRGGQGEGYEAYQNATRRRVALKVLLGGSFAGQDSKRRFEREIELAANLNHRSIVTIHDSGITRGNYYLVMDFVDGERLDHYVVSGSLSIRQKLELFCKVCEAVSFAHQRGVIHRDLKPSNILVNASGEPFILDFGLARRMEDESITSLSTEGQLLGTPQYMAPEQAEGKMSDIDVRTDVYALGVILYRILTGTHPYPVTGRVTEILNNIVEAQPMKPSSLLRHLDSDVEVIILKSLAKDPDHRYQSVAELQQDIQFWLQGMPIVARSVSSVYVLRKLISRHRYTSTVVGLVAVILCACSFICFDLYRTAEAAREESENIRNRMMEETKDMYALRNGTYFETFLQAWQTGSMRDAYMMSKCITENSREAYAVRFLLDPRPLAEKEKAFREKVGIFQVSFVEFVMGELYLNRGLLIQARDRYERSKEHLPPDGSDVWLRLQVKNRLVELSFLEDLRRSSVSSGRHNGVSGKDEVLRGQRENTLMALH